MNFNFLNRPIKRLSTAQIKTYMKECRQLMLMWFILLITGSLWLLYVESFVMPIGNNTFMLFGFLFLIMLEVFYYQHYRTILEIRQK